MRKTCLDMVYEMAKADERVFFIGSDLGVGTLDKFKKEIPERFLMEGISEANIVGMAAGMALEGSIPYINTIGVFLTRRCFEQITLDLCLHHLNVRLIGSGGGLVYAPLGPSHLAIEDMAILRCLPNMTILAPADASEMSRLMPLTLEHQGPIYIRLAKGGDAIVTPAEAEYKIGRAVPIRDGNDAVIITTGVGLHVALEAADSLAAQGVRAGVLHMHTVKPVDKEAILQRLQQAPVAVTVEEGVINGGLGSAVAEIVAEANFNPSKKFARIGIPDVFADRYGSQAELMRYYGITAENVADTVKRLAG
ncbi:MAG: transketolase [Nitrospinae bacterium]|nr:transketolase [Nitrospinota bacterium]